MLKCEDIPNVNSERWLSLNDLPDELWKPVKGFEGKYMVSNYGRVKTIGRNVNWTLRDGSIAQVYIASKMLRQQMNYKGYYRITLRRDKKDFNIAVQRIVGITFLSNPNDLPQINHKDENKENNCVSNLEWCTAKYNNNYATKNDRLSETMRKHYVPRSFAARKVVQYDKKGVFISEYPSLKQAERITGIDVSGISKCCRGIYKQFRGFVWQYK